MSIYVKGSIVNINEGMKGVELLKDFFTYVEKDVVIAVKYYIQDIVHPKLEKKAKNIIKSGGTTNPNYIWKVWENTSGQKNYESINDWQLIKPASKVRNFSYSTYLPIRPTSYHRYRKNRRTFKKTQYALTDTGAMNESWRYVFLNNADSDGFTYSFFNMQNYFKYHENELFGRPARPVLAPLKDYFDTSSMPKAIMREAKNAVKTSVFKKHFRIID